LRFQTTKRVQGQDPELVLGVLEGCLRSLSNEVVRQGSQITLLGLGPSPRAINRRDTTVIDVKRENGATVIHADVRFQASAFLGMAAQDVVVKEKLDHIFDDMLTQLGLSGWASPLEKVDGPAATSASVERLAANSVEPVLAAQQTFVQASSTVPVASETPSDNPPAGDAEPASAGEPGKKAEPTRSMAESDIPATAEVPVAGEPIRERLPVESASGSTASSTTEPGASPQVRVTVLEEEITVEEKQLQAPKAILAPEVKLPDTVEASTAVKTDSGRKADVPKSGAPGVAEKTLEASSKPAEEAPIASAENVRPLSANVAASSFRLEKSAESKKDTVEEKKPALPVKPEAPSLKAPSAQRGSSAITPLKPAMPRTAAVTKAPAQPALSAPAKNMLGASSFEDEPEASSKWLKWSAWIAAFIVLVVAPLVWLYMPSHPESATPVSQPSPAAAAPAPAPQPPILAKQPGDDPDPVMVISDWEAAMNSRDADAQAAFYADPVERYFLRHNLSRDEVKADKLAAINRRRDDWSVKMENVKITRADDNTAKARLIKHYTVKEDGKMASEWFVPSLLLMTRANGRWQITSERDLGWATSLDELDH